MSQEVTRASRCCMGMDGEVGGRVRKGGGIPCVMIGLLEVARARGRAG